MCLTFTYPPYLTLSIFPNHDTKIIPPSTSAIFSAVYIIDYLAVPNDPPSLIRKKCYPTFLHHKTSALLSNFNALILSPRNSISRCSPKQFHCNESNSNNSISQCLPPCSTAFINEMNMLPQQVHITSNLQSSNNVTSAVYITMLLQLPQFSLMQRTKSYPKSLTSNFQACAKLSQTEFMLCHS